MMDLYKLDNTIQEYSWGSVTDIPNLLGRSNPESTPQAELWMGTHPKAPSNVVVHGQTTSLPEVISKNPGGILGAAAAERYGGKLPFLFKVLAAGKPLSIQSHPNLEQAKDGFRRENERGIPLDAPHRNYQDANHKPEIICALTPFWAMCGFRPVEQIVENFSPFGASVLSEPLDALRRGQSSAALRVFFSFLLGLEPGQVASLADRACEVAAQEKGDRSDWVLELNRLFPGDLGVICPLLLNVYHLKPGQAVYLDAGELHAYLSGLGIELMANSDNVLRGGLTPKHMDVTELLSTLTFQAAEVPVLEGRDLGGAETVYDCPADEFRLSRIEVRSGLTYQAAAERSVEILIVTEGTCLIECDGKTMSAAKGESLLVPADACDYAISGSGVLFKATIP
jgi:mannose-6-phosphate isomerase